MSLCRMVQSWVTCDGAGWPPCDQEGEVNQTERVLAILLFLAFMAIAVVAVYAAALGWGKASGGLGFLVWSLLTAFGASLAGVLLGMLFGLPSVVEVRIADGGTNPQDPSRLAGAPLGYRESTNLEQVADWITKILIGLTLTQYSQWEAALERAFVLASTQMFGGGPQPAAPAAIIAMGFAANGFLAAYLVMRRYFITEMVKGRDDAQKATRAREKVAVAREGGFLQDGSVTRAPANMPDEAAAMADRAAELSPNQSLDAAQNIAQEVREELAYPDDPWRGTFGGSSSGGGCRLEGKIEALEGSNELFTIRLSVVADKPADRIGQSVTFYLHPTFGAEPKKVAFGQDGVAGLELIAYGAFTVGALLETGERLELNLATLPDAPALFRVR